MFASLPSIQQFPPAPLPWTPARSSPLSPRRTPPTASSSFTSTTATTTPEMNDRSSSKNASIFAFSPSPNSTNNTMNVNTANSVLTSPTPLPRNTNTISSRSRTSSTYANRYTTQISNPLGQRSSPRSYTTSSSPSARAVRRNVFLNRIKQNRDDGRFENRGEQLMFLENVAEQKMWGDIMRKRAEEIASQMEEMGDEYQYDEEELQALDEYLKQEQELETELLGYMNTQIAPSDQHQQNRRDGASFSDEEYDDIFMDLAEPNPTSDPSQDVEMS